MPINRHYQSLSELPSVLPVFPLTGVLLLPGAQLPLNIFEPRYLKMTDDALASHRMIGMIQPANPEDSLQGSPSLRQIGCAGRITHLAETGDGRYLLTLSGIARFRIVEECATSCLYRACKVDFSEFGSDLQSIPEDMTIDRDYFVQTLRSFSNAKNLRIDHKEISQATNETLVNAIAIMGPFGPEEKQALLESPTIRSRADALIAIMEIDLAHKMGANKNLQ